MYYINHKPILTNCHKILQLSHIGTAIISSSLWKTGTNCFFLLISFATFYSYTKCIASLNNISMHTEYIIINRNVHGIQMSLKHFWQYFMKYAAFIECATINTRKFSWCSSTAINHTSQWHSPNINYHTNIRTLRVYCTFQCTQAR